VLDEKVPDPSLLSTSQDVPEIDGALPHVDLAVLRRSRRVLHVHHLEPAGVTGEVFQRVLTAFGDPEEVELQRDVGGIGLGEQYVVRQPAVQWRKLEVVVVIGESETGSLGLLAQPVALSGKTLEIAEGASALRRQPG
jgi:hypothetical protein